MRPRQLERRRGRRSARGEQKRRSGRVGRPRGRRFTLVERSRERERSEGECCLCPSDLFVIRRCAACSTVTREGIVDTSHDYLLARNPTAALHPICWDCVTHTRIRTSPPFKTRCASIRRLEYDEVDALHITIHTLFPKCTSRSLVKIVAVGRTFFNYCFLTRASNNGKI